MRQNFVRMSALLAIAVAACVEPTGTPNGAQSGSTIRSIATNGGGQINIAAGNNIISASTNAFTPTDVAVTVLDPTGAATAGAVVTFTTVTVTGAATRSQVGFGATCSTSLGTTVTATTNASGVAVARWCFTGVGGQQLTASYGGGTVTFNGIATTTGGAPTLSKEQGDAQNNTMGGQPVPANPTVKVMDPDGTTVLGGVILTFTASGTGTISGGSCSNCTSGTIATSAAGRSAAVWTLGAAGANTLVASNSYVTGAGVPISSVTFTATALGVGTSMTCVSGCSNSAADIAGRQFGPKDPAVLITTAAGAGVAGAAVTVTYGAGTNACGQALTGQVLTQVLTTNANGIVAVPWCVLTPAITTRTITFSSGNLSATISASETADFTTNNGSLTIDSGTGFTCTVNGTATPDLAVTLLDAQGVKVSGRSITFTAPTGGTVANGTTTGNSITVTTNSAGQASARLTCGELAGATSVSVVSSTSATTSITGTANAGAAVSLAIIGGDNQTATAGTTLAKNPTVIVKDVYGNTVNNVNTTWTTSNGTVAQTVVATGNAGQGSVAGVAANRWTLSSTAGAQTLTVTAAGVTGSVTFNATGN